MTSTYGPKDFQIAACHGEKPWEPVLSSGLIPDLRKLEDLGPSLSVDQEKIVDNAMRHIT